MRIGEEHVDVLVSRRLPAREGRLAQPSGNDVRPTFATARHLGAILS